MFGTGCIGLKTTFHLEILPGDPGTGSLMASMPDRLGDEHRRTLFVPANGINHAHELADAGDDYPVRSMRQPFIIGPFRLISQLDILWVPGQVAW